MLDSSGYTIRNTFIHSPPSCAPASRRVQSAPPSRQKGLDLLDSRSFRDGEWWSPMLPHHVPQPTPAQLVPDHGNSQKSPGTESCTSTTCSENDPTVHNSCMMNAVNFVMVPGFWQWATQQICASTSASKVAELVMSECQFLRIQEYRVLPDISKKAMRRNSSWTLRFYVCGVPSQKRARWLQPLFVSVAAMLRRRGCTTRVQGCEFFVSLEHDREAIRIDFAASRG